MQLQALPLFGPAQPLLPPPGEPWMVALPLAAVRSIGLKQPCWGVAGKLLFGPPFAEQFVTSEFSLAAVGAWAAPTPSPGSTAAPAPCPRLSQHRPWHRLAQLAAIPLTGGCYFKTFFLRVKRKPEAWPRSPSSPQRCSGAARCLGRLPLRLQ